INQRYTRILPRPVSTCPRGALSTLLPYTTLFRSLVHVDHDHSARRIELGGQQRRHADRSGADDCDDITRLDRAVQHADLESGGRSEEHTSELQSRENLVCRLLLENKNTRV